MTGIVPRFVSAFIISIAVTVAEGASTGRASINNRSKEPYLGAIVIDASTGAVLFEDSADEPGYPASVIKLMDMLIIQDRIDSGTLSVTNTITISKEVAQIGGSQVYLKQGEVFPVEDLLYALMIQSANDAAEALALHIGGTTMQFVALMNRRAAELGMTGTRFQSVHGLPPGVGQSPDVSTARDLAKLGCEIVKHPAILKYTSTRERGFRGGTFIMQTHDHLLATVQGCDGLKTGYFKAGGFSIVASVQREGRRIIAVVLGSPTREGRDRTAKELIAKCFMNLPPPPLPQIVRPVALSNTVHVLQPVAPAPDLKRNTSGTWRWIINACFIIVGAIIVLIIGIRIGNRGR